MSNIEKAAAGAVIGIGCATVIASLAIEGALVYAGWEVGPLFVPDNTVESKMAFNSAVQTENQTKETYTQSTIGVPLSA